MFPESFRELLESPGVCVLSTIEPDTTPQSSAVWYLLGEDDKLRLSLNSTRRKLQNLQRNPGLSVLFLDPQNPYRTLELRGRAQLELDEDRSFRDLVGAKYDADLSEHDGPTDERYIVTVEPTRVREWPPPA